MKLNVLSLAYEKTMDRINGQKEGFKLLAKNTLSWILCAKNPLTTTELQHALAVEINEPELDEDNLPQVEDMVSVCAGLVTVDEESNIIRLVHYTTQEYFERTQSHWFPDVETNITMTCITYLSFDIFERGFCQTDDEFKDLLQSNPFFEYAARNWGHHARKCSTLGQVLSHAIVGFLQSEAKVAISGQGLLARKGFSYDFQYIPRQITGLHLAAYFGVSTVVQVLLAQGAEIEAKDSDYQTPLFWAAKYGHEAIVKLLLEIEKIDVNSQNIRCETPLFRAARYGHEAVVRFLLKTENIDVNSRNIRRQTPLSMAARYGHEAIVRLLLETEKVDVDLRNKWGETPLSNAARLGYEAIVRLLLETEKVDVDSRDKWDETPLLRAAKYGHEVVVKLLLETEKVDVDSKDKLGHTALFWADGGDETIVKLLLEHGAKFESVS